MSQFIEQVNGKLKAEDVKPEDYVKVPKALELAKSTECFVTPSDVARMMAVHLNIQPNDTILEPQAGTGQLVSAVFDEIKRYGFSNYITTVEKNFTLAQKHGWFCHDFIEWAEAQQDTDTRFDKIICNPPFRTIKAHMRAAKSMLKPLGTMIALVPATYRELSHNVISVLAPDTFPTIKVNTKIIQVWGNLPPHITGRS